MERSYLLTKEEKDNNQLHFFSTCMSLMKENQTFRVSLFDKHLETVWKNYRFLHFPKNTEGNEKSTNENHWTLLVLDKEDNLWSVDCGLFVCYVMRQYSNHEPISSKLSTQDVRLMRAEIIERFVTEVGWS
ncbi:uncharacterized protein LOC114293782 [Camellia sinensis]|uniref:uncharacterized protein LOC114293782 n=1 Tax=Camellia sinensis TaxID=4442 RepID=UPI001035AE05|nr:uncharacterized protein LOC114293782 [Camellia sinensis]